MLPDYFRAYLEEQSPDGSVCCQAHSEVFDSVLEKIVGPEYADWIETSTETSGGRIIQHCLHMWRVFPRGDRNASTKGQLVSDMVTQFLHIQKGPFPDLYFEVPHEHVASIHARIQREEDPRRQFEKPSAMLQGTWHAVQQQPDQLGVVSDTSASPCLHGTPSGNGLRDRSPRRGHSL